RGGLKAKLLSFFLLNKGLRQKRTQNGEHERDYNLALLKDLLSLEDKKYNPCLFIKEQERQIDFKKFQEAQKAQGKIFLPQLLWIHPGMSHHSVSWPASYYADLIKKIEEERPNFFSYVISYTQADLMRLKEFQTQLGVVPFEDRIIFFNGSYFNLRTFLHLLSYASFYIGGSTGPTHLAGSLGLNILALYSQIKAQSKERWGVVGEGVIFNECIEDVTIQDVLNKILSFHQKKISVP
nr:hypothetical protein [Bacteriovoracaceae bacterium]